MNSRNAELAAIHVAKKQLGLDDETYRTMLTTVAGKRSAAELDDSGRRRVLEHLQSRGFVNVKRRPKRQSDDPLTEKIRSLWAALAERGVVRDGSEKALGAFVVRQTGVRSVEWVSTEQAMHVIEALKAWGKRVKRGGEDVCA